MRQAPSLSAVPACLPDTGGSGFAVLSAAGLNLHAVFDLATLPRELIATLGLPESGLARFRQLILIGHLGCGFWDALQRRGLHGSDPVDQFVTERVAAWMADELPGHAWQPVFPGPAPVGLQRLGHLAGWHHASPFWIGIDAEWGSWFAYRAVWLTDTALPPTPRRELASPCPNCSEKPCVSACPAGALSVERGGLGTGSTPGLHACLDHRLQPATACADRCLARNACPVGERYRYSEAQTRYHYLQSLRMIRARY